MVYRRILAIVGLLGLSFLGVVAVARGAPPPAVTPIPALRPLVAAPPEILAEAGILPSVPVLWLLDALDEWMERNVFSFGLPKLRARIMLTQLAERTAELQALERRGQLTPRALRHLVERQERLLAAVNHLVARGIVRGTISAELVLIFTRTRLAAAEAFEELREERAVLATDLEDDVPPVVGRAAPSPESVRRGAEDVLNGDDDAEVVVDSILREIVEKLSDVDGDVLPARDVPPDILRVLAGQQVGKAGRDLLHAQERVGDRRAAGDVIIAEAEVRAAAESSWATARQLAAEGHGREALALAKEARELAARLWRGELAVHPRARRAHEEVDEILRVLVDEGVISLPEHAAAGARAHQAIDEARARQ